MRGLVEAAGRLSAASAAWRVRAYGLGLIAALGLLGASPAPNLDGQRLAGVVIDVDGGTGTVLVRHDPVGGMPGMTMSFSVPTPVLATLHASDRITAVIASTGSPWRLRDVRVVGTEPPETYVPVLDVGAVVPELPLVDEDGRAFSFRKLGGRTAIVAFIYTRCGDAKMCPLVSAKFSRLQRTIDPASMRLVEVTLDPAFDTSAVLRRYGSTFDARPDRWTFVTGSPHAIDELSRRMGVVSTPGQGGALLHSEALVILDSDGRIVDRLDGNTWTAEQALAVARIAVHQHVNPLVRVSLALSSGIVAICGGRASGLTLAAAIAIFLVILSTIAFVTFRAFRAPGATRRSERKG